MTIHREPITFMGVICSPFINIPYTYAMITPKYDNGAYMEGFNFEIAKKRRRYPTRPITPFNTKDKFIDLFAKFIWLNSNPVIRREPGK